MKTANSSETSSAKAVVDVNSQSKASAIIQKMKDDKKAIKQFFRGEISIQEIDARGIKFVKPI
ncbi:hypothetical protein [Dyadobacter sp. MSC1_007]|jgi:hypothetical protein|uniref:hypothetical protein n=1 Tax=Dyadobacter sp. MSC1_007 TaxID=2909264 RepID=UPI00202F51D2|nr:hypothetical protein [Dyadobacter sp. MSC1_007]